MHLLVIVRRRLVGKVLQLYEFGCMARFGNPVCDLVECEGN